MLKILLSAIILLGVTLFTAQAAQQELPAACHQLPEDGDCKALFTIAYYDQESRACYEAFHGGCNGVVPFDNIEDCQEACETEDALRLTEFRQLADTPGYARLQLAFPPSWGEPVIVAQVNGRPVEARITGSGNTPSREVRELQVFLGDTAPRRLRLSTQVDGREHVAEATLHWNLAAGVCLLDGAGTNQALLAPAPLRLALMNLTKVRVLHDGQELVGHPVADAFRHGQVLELKPDWHFGRNRIEVEATTGDGRSLRQEYSFVNLQRALLAPGEPFRLTPGPAESRSGPFYRIELEGEAVLSEPSPREETLHSLDDDGWLVSSRSQAFEIRAQKPGSARLRLFVKDHFTQPERLLGDIHLEVTEQFSF